MSEVLQRVDCKLLFNSVTQSESALILLRSKLVAIARRLGVSNLERENMLLVAAELVSNNVKHAAGRGMVQLWMQPGGVLDMLALDYGPGIANLAAAEEDGYSTLSTLGKGLGAIRRLSGESYIYTQQAQPGQPRKWSGTVILARFFLGKKDKEESPLSNSACIPVPCLMYVTTATEFICKQEQYCAGCTWTGWGTVRKRRRPLPIWQLLNYESPQAMLTAVDQQLHDTRGAVAITGEIDLTKYSLRLSGVGDMNAHIYDQEQIQHIAFAPGILGREHRTANVLQTGFGKKCVIVTTSDGIRRNWDAANFVGLFNQHPQLIAYALGNIMGRISDVQSICVCTIG
jgi:anti-sigma regulatory factor (Ser/Thr protein kinase)